MDLAGLYFPVSLTCQDRQVRAPIRSCYVNIAFGAPLPAGELAALCKVLDRGVSPWGFTMGCNQGRGGKAPAGRGGDFVLWRLLFVLSFEAYLFSGFLLDFNELF